MGRSPFSQAPISPSDRIADVSFEAARDKSQKAGALLGRLDALDLDSAPAELALTLRIARFDLRRIAKAADWYWLALIRPAAASTPCSRPQVIAGDFSSAGSSVFSKGFRLKETATAIAISTNQRYGAHHRPVGGTHRRPGGARHLHAERAARTGNRAAARPAQDAGCGDCRSGCEAGEVGDALVQHGIPPPRDGRDRTGLCASRGDFPPIPLMEPVRQTRSAWRNIPAAPTSMPNSSKYTQQWNDTRRSSSRRAGTDEERSHQHGGHQSGNQIFGGSDKDYLKSLESDPRWRATTSEGIGAVFQRYIDRLKPHFAELFDFESPCPYGAAPLAAALEASMTFGYYDMPRPGKPRGDYMFNTANLSQNALFNIGALNYHELVPGHHLHLSVQLSNDRVSLFTTPPSSAPSTKAGPNIRRRLQAKQACMKLAE